MRFKLLAAVLLTSLLLASAQQLPTGGDIGEGIGRGVGTAVVQQTGLDRTVSQAFEILNLLVQLVIYSFAIFAFVFVIWLVLTLWTMSHIMRREDLSGSEKLAWIYITLFGGFIPLSIFGIILYHWIGRKPRVQKK
ncbi:hypothetical protein HY571_01140 [Candidatus Micrarchaeota archaeon]|nr:hypothetical protein [Candidatus Micrarchaeota archaeon]